MTGQAAQAAQVAAALCVGAGAWLLLAGGAAEAGPARALAVVV